MFCCEKKFSSRFILNFISIMFRTVLFPSLSAGMISRTDGRSLPSNTFNSDAFSVLTR